jgi:hypothetical protein
LSLQSNEGPLDKKTMGIFDFFRRRSPREAATTEKNDFQAMLKMSEAEFQEYQKRANEEFKKHDYLGFAATAKHKALAAVETKQYDQAWKLFHDQKLHYMKHAARSEFTRLQGLALDACVSENLANILRLQGKHQDALVHAVYWVAASPRRTKTQDRKLPAYFNRANLKDVEYSAVEALLKVVQSNPELPIIQRHVKKWADVT